MRKLMSSFYLFLFLIFLHFPEHIFPKMILHSVLYRCGANHQFYLGFEPKIIACSKMLQIIITWKIWLIFKRFVQLGLNGTCHKGALKIIGKCTCTVALFFWGSSSRISLAVARLETSKKLGRSIICQLCNNVGLFATATPPGSKL